MCLRSCGSRHGERPIARARAPRTSRYPRCPARILLRASHARPALAIAPAGRAALVVRTPRAVGRFGATEANWRAARIVALTTPGEAIVTQTPLTRTADMHAVPFDAGIGKEAGGEHM